MDFGATKEFLPFSVVKYKSNLKFCTTNHQSLLRICFPYVDYNSIFFSSQSNDIKKRHFAAFLAQERLIFFYAFTWKNKYGRGVVRACSAAIATQETQRQLDYLNI